MNILIAPDSFKGSLSSLEVARSLERVFSKVFPEAVCRSVPIADGGEGTVEAFLAALGGERVEVTTQGPLGEELVSFYGRAPGDVAIVEMAASAGLPLMKEKAPLEASTYGVGELIRHALEQGAETILLGLGGSATTDGGAGAAAALGVRFCRKDGSDFVPTGGTLGEIASVELDGLHSGLSSCRLVTLCDIDNPLLGERGAARVFSPQKGATPEEVILLEKGLQHFSSFLPSDSRTLPGGGAAGGFGAGAHGLLGATLLAGMEVLFDQSALEMYIQEADIVITGEGKMDAQSLAGKAPVAIARRARQAGKTVIAFTGNYEGDMEMFFEEGFDALFSIVPGACTIEEAMNHAAKNLESTAFSVAQLLRKGVWNDPKK